jgi:trehalose 6-phosphate phosphatase
MTRPWAIGPRLRRRVGDLARARLLLVVCDYDGTLAPIVDDPSEAWPDRAALDALSELGALPDTRAVVVSGRDLAQLRRLTGSPGGIELIGGHGAESDGEAPAIASDRRRRLDEIASRFRSLAEKYPGALVDDKPTSVVFHYRQVDEAAQGAAAADAARLADEYPDVEMMTGKCVVEFLGSDVDKGSVIVSLTGRNGADRVVFFGDDVTDEDGFAALRPDDVGVKVGRGPTAARYRVRNVASAARTLRRLARLRRRECERIVP